MKKSVLTVNIAESEKRDFISSALSNNKGKFVTFGFIKKDGSKRIATGRLGVKKHTNGGTNTTSHLAQYVTVWEPSIKRYTHVNLDKVYMFNGCGSRINFEAA